MSDLPGGAACPAPGVCERVFPVTREGGKGPAVTCVVAAARRVTLGLKGVVLRPYAVGCPSVASACVPGIGCPGQHPFAGRGPRVRGCNASRRGPRRPGVKSQTRSLPMCGGQSRRLAVTQWRLVVSSGPCLLRVQCQRPGLSQVTISSSSGLAICGRGHHLYAHVQCVLEYFLKPLA